MYDVFHNFHGCTLWYIYLINIPFWVQSKGWYDRPFSAFSWPWRSDEDSFPQGNNRETDCSDSIKVFPVVSLTWPVWLCAHSTIVCAHPNFMIGLMWKGKLRIKLRIFQDFYQNFLVVSIIYLVNQLTQQVPSFFSLYLKDLQ